MVSRSSLCLPTSVASARAANVRPSVRFTPCARCTSRSMTGSCRASAAGLTAIDTASESLAYCPVQVEKFLLRYETLVAERGKPAVHALWNPEESRIAEEFLAHARAIRSEREAARAEGRDARIVELLQS